MKPTFFLTTPIYYPNARPHVGSAYTTIVCDVLARYKRMCGYDVAFLTGTDEHGEKLERAAAAAGQSPHDFVAEKRELFVDLWEKLGMQVVKYPKSPEPDRLSLRFIYTDHKDHEKTVRDMLLKAKKNDYITKRRYEGRYCIYDERYVSDNTEPVNCDVCGRPAELISEENYFFKLSKFGPAEPGGDDGPLLSFYRDNPSFVQPSYRMNEVKSFVKSGLRDISVSRKRIKWGFPFPLDAERNDPEQVVYVWYDALTSYMTGIGYSQLESGEFKKYWRNIPDESELVHMIGKDILRFHAVYWPAFIMAAYPDQPEMLPTTVFAHGWIYHEQDKMSKSKGNVVYPEPIVDALDSFGAPGNDALRYYLLSDTPFGQDANFSYEGLIDRFNFDLANDFGNLVSRTITMIHRYFDGIVPTPPANHVDEMLPLIKKDPPEGFRTSYMSRMDNLNLSHGVGRVHNLIGEFNRYLTTMQPWLAKDDVRRATLYGAADGIRIAAVLLSPFMPASAQRAWKQLGCEGEVEDQRIDQLDWDQLKPGTKVGKAEPIFPRLDKEKTLAKLDELSARDRERGTPTVGALREAPLQADRLQTNPIQADPPQSNFAEADRNRDKPKEALKSVENEKTPGAAPESPSGTGVPPVKEDTAKMAVPQTPSPEPRVPSPAPPVEPARISIDDFAKVEMRTGEIKAAERIPGATKLLKLQVDIGTEVRQVLAGIAEYYEPEKLIGMKVVIVANLQPRKMRGLESNGMIVAASIGETGRPVLVTFGEDVPNGAKLK